MERFALTGQRRKVMLASGWKPVATAEDIGAHDGDCPECLIDFALCDCPCTELEGFDYQTVDGVTYARPRCNS